MLDPDPIVGPLQASVYERLEDLTRSADLLDDEHAAELARREIPLLVQALKSVLATHDPDARGRCTLCGERRSRFPFRRRGRHLPCRAYLAVQLRLGTVEKAIPHREHTRHRQHHHCRRAHLHSVS
ncbi:MAG TPA: hypothetical protein VHC18_07890 [Amycolatopsis sp.]|nr:hypothetical protein [Amycolatopsis sp.]